MFDRVCSAAAAVLCAALVCGGCAADTTRSGPSEHYDQATARGPAPKCPSGYVLQCESKKVGRIRFGRIGNQNLESCACELYQGMPTQSPLPGIQDIH